VKIENPENQIVYKELYAWVSVDDQGKEGILAFRTSESDNGLTLVDSSLSVMKHFEDWVQSISDNTGRKMRLKRFKYPDVVMEIEPL
jgi:hypothetical protein